MSDPLLFVDNSANTVYLTGSKTITGLTTINNATTITDTTTINNATTINNTATINNATTINGATTITGDCNMNGAQSYPSTPMAMMARSAGRVYANNTYVCNVTAYNRGSCYNTSNGRFTAPVGFSGYYLCLYNGLGGANDTGPNTRWYRNGSVFNWGAAHVNNSCTSRHGTHAMIVVQLNAGDYIELRLITSSLYGSGQRHGTFCYKYISS